MNGDGNYSPWIDVDSFADEMFRVYANAHPEIGLYPFNADQQVLDMIRHVKTNAVDTKPV